MGGKHQTAQPDAPMSPTQRTHAPTGPGVLATPHPQDLKKAAVWSSLDVLVTFLSSGRGGGSLITQSPKTPMKQVVWLVSGVPCELLALERPST